jgi:membrane protein
METSNDLEKTIEIEQDQSVEQEVLLCPKAKHSIKIELLTSFSIVLFVSLIGTLLGSLFPLKMDEVIDFTYSSGKVFTFAPSFAIAATCIGFIVTFLSILSLTLIRPSGITPLLGKRGKNLIFLSLLSIFGVLAYLVISLFLAGMKISPYMSMFIAGTLVAIYDTFIYKLYLEERTYSNHLFWEIFRFAIVGLVAAVFDFLLCFIFQFYVFHGGNAWYVTGISTAMGFCLGVIINYLMSTYMVYKNTKTDTSKTIKGMALFLILAVIGLLIGIGIQYLFYDYLNLKVGVTFFSYPIVFIFRTLIVMVYNYISRKLFIYK